MHAVRSQLDKMGLVAFLHIPREGIYELPATNPLTRL